MSKLELILLGRFECLLSAGTRVSLAMRKAEVLLAFLALAPGLRHPRERLINLLWSDRGEEQARNSLRQCLSAIRKSLGAAADMVLLIDRSSVCLNAELVEVDAHEFERLAGEGDYESLLTAADLYQGEFLEGISIRDAASQEWLDSERNRFKRQFIEILYNLAETQLVSHDYANAIRSAERLVEQDQLAESGWRLLMQSYAAHGDRSHALQAYKRCQQALQNELDVEPESATVELRDRIAGGESRPASAPATPQPATRTPGDESSIVVLPFDNLSGDPEQEYFSDGITDSIIMNLALFPGLQVKSRNASFAFKQQIKSIGEISRELGVDYIVEGSIRRSAGRVRVNVQLIEASNASQVWGKRYDADLDDLFELEEDLSRSIAATVTGQIESELQRIAIAKGAADQQAYDLLLAGIYHLQRANRKDNAIAIEKLNACLERDPDNARAHAWLYDCHHFSVMDRWSNDLDQSRQLAINHIERAIELEPEQKSVLLSYIDFLTFQHRYDEAEAQVQRALANNPNEAGAYAARAVNLSSMAKWPEAVEAAEIALRLDPHNYWGMWILAESLFFCDRYEECLETIARTDNAPGFVLVYNIAANIELGRRDAAKKSLDAFIDFCDENMLTPPASVDEWRQYFLDNAPFADSSVNERILNLLLDAGLEIKTGGSSSVPRKSDQGISSIAVLPFDNLSGDPEQEYFSDGITESIIFNLALFPGLHVKSRHSSFAFKQQLKGLTEISRELDVDYLVEGSVRKANDRIRITTQLIEAASGNQVWGKRYDAELADLLDLEEDLSRSIAATVTGRIESELRRVAIAKGAADQQAYDLLLAGMYHVSRFNAADNDIAIDMFERCLVQDPDNVRAHVGLYICYNMAYLGRWIENRKNSFDKSWDYIRRASQLDPEDRAAQVFLAEMLGFRGELDKAKQQIDKVLAQNPNDTDALAVLASIQSFLCDPGSALNTAEQALKLDPFHPWAEWELAVARYYCDDYEGTLDAFTAMRSAPPGFIDLYEVAALVRLERIDEARTALRKFMRECESSMKEIPRNIDEWIEYTRENYLFVDAQRNHDLVDTLLQAGLEEFLSGEHTQAASSSLPSILVLPFSNQSGDPEQEYFSDGITAGVILSLALFDGIVVKSQKTSFAFKTSDLSSMEIAGQVGADYLVEGSIRKSARRIRLSVQLIEAENGSQIWGHQYDEVLQDVLELEQKLSQALAATISGRLGHRIQQSAALKPAKNLQAYEHLMRGLYHFGKFTAEDMVIAREEIEQCLAVDPDNVQAHANLGQACTIEMLENWTEDRAKTEQQAYEHFETALALEPNSSLAHAYFADFLFICEQYDKASFHADRAIEINPNSSEGHAARTDLLSADRRHDEAIREAEICLQLDPYSVGSIWVAGDAYRKAGRYEEAIKIFRRMPNPPPSINAYIASCLAAMGLVDEGRTEMKRFLKLAKQQMSNFPDSIAGWREYWRNSTAFRHGEDFEILFSQLLETGLGDELEGDKPELPAIAVLPFENLSGDPEQEYFSDGITDSVIINLAASPGLRVKSRHASFAFKDSSRGVGDIAAELGVHYIVAGSIRKAGDKVRITAQLSETGSGNQVWGKRFDYDLDDLFALEEDLSMTIAGSISTRIGKQARLSALRKPAKDLQSYDYYMRGSYYLELFTAENIGIAMELLDKCLSLDPDNSLAHAKAGIAHMVALYENCAADREASLKLMDEHLQRALELDPDDAEAHAFMAEMLMYRRDFDRALVHARKAVELNPTLADGYSMLAWHAGATGKLDEARGWAEKSMQTDIHHPYAGWNAGEIYRLCGDYELAIETFRSMAHMSTSVQAQIAACLAGLNRIDEARSEMRRYLELAREQMSAMPSSPEEWYDFWWESMPYKQKADNDRYFDLLLQAGLCDQLENSAKI